MGKVRINTIGDKTAEEKQKIEAKKRQEVKKSEKKADDSVQMNSGTPKESSQEKSTEVKTKKKVQKKPEEKAPKRSPRYISSKKIADRNKLYKLPDALEILTQMQKAKFDETVELHINTLEKGVAGNVILPHGTGKQTRVVIISPSRDQKAADELIKRIESGKIDFDVLIATPDAMPKLAKVARFLGPRGLMPNPKAGTVTPKPEELAKKYEGGQIAYKTEVKSPIIHVTVGKMSFGKDKLAENITVFLQSVEKTKIKNVYIKTTMSPSLKLTV